MVNIIFYTQVNLSALLLATSNELESKGTLGLAEANPGPYFTYLLTISRL